jgi:hypothetical protein
LTGKGEEIELKEVARLKEHQDTDFSPESVELALS